MMKKALHDRVKKSLVVQISISPDHGDSHPNQDKEELQKSSELAPSVTDSDEPGVIKSDADPMNKMAQVGGDMKSKHGLDSKLAQAHKLEESMESPKIEAGETPEDDQKEEEYLKQMISRTPENPKAGGKTLNGRAREVMLAKLAHNRAKKI